MREIKFRGKNSAGYWVYGGYLYEKELEEHRIITDSVEFSELCESIVVQPETVGEFTGLRNKNNKDVYEGDAFRQEIEHDFGDEREYSIVTWIRERGAFYLIPTAHYHIYLDNDLEEDPDFEWLFDQAALYDFNRDTGGLDPCGNIHDNPEILDK